MNSFANWEEVPIFDSESAEADFWAEYRPDLRLMETAVANTSEAESVTITLRMDPRMLARIKRLARSRYLNYQSMIKQWLSERMEHELRERGTGESLNPQAHPRLNRPGAFTLIELLVVISIIVILAGLIVGLAGVAMSKSRLAQARIAVDYLDSAINQYKIKKGMFPPDNSNITNVGNSFVVNPLFYELHGTIIQNPPNPSNPVFTNLMFSHDTIVGGTGGPSLTAQYFNVAGFVNSSPDPTEVYNLVPTLKAAQIKNININNAAAPVWVFVLPSQGPPYPNLPAGVNPIFYNATNPTNNPNSFDLWVDVIVKGQTNRVSNWSKDPVLIAHY